MWPYFSPTLLDQIRFVELKANGSPPPSSTPRLAPRALTTFPKSRTWTRSTFIDVVVFNEELTERSLFHALVHAV